VVLAARGARNLDSGEAPVQDKDVAEGFRRRARRIHIKAILTAALLTLSRLYF